MTTPVDIDAVLRAAEKATKLPWMVHNNLSDPDFCVVTESGKYRGVTIAEMIDKHTDAQFIVLACNSVVAMAEEIRGLRAENARLKAVPECYICSASLLPPTGIKNRCFDCYDLEEGG